jgi:hypothetical protein
MLEAQAKGGKVRIIWRVIPPIKIIQGTRDIHLRKMRAPSGSGYTKIYSNGHAFAALKADGSITALALDVGVMPPGSAPHAVIEPSALINGLKYLKTLKEPWCDLSES